nr:beta-1,3-glucan-binding protein-like isoform X3 [Procambarus clarkii]
MPCFSVYIHLRTGNCAFWSNWRETAEQSRAEDSSRDRLSAGQGMMMLRALSFLLVASWALAADVIDPNDCFEFPCLIFNDEFDDGIDENVWEHEISMYGGRQLTSNWKSEEFLRSGELNLGEACTESANYGCWRTGDPDYILNPIMSARLRTLPSFAFRYGRVEVRAKMPRGDWLWPAIWLLPRNSRYGRWPKSGSIGIAESRDFMRTNLSLYWAGNDDYGGLGHMQAESSLHWGPNPQINLYPNTQQIYTTENDSSDSSTKNDSPNSSTKNGCLKRAVETEPCTSETSRNDSFSDNFHTWRLDWTKDKMTFYVDGKEKLMVDPGKNFWNLSGLGSSLSNPWKSGGKMAPFDQKFYMIMNLAVGGVNGYFPDDVASCPPKPWTNHSPHASRDFWNAREWWLPSWEHCEGHISEKAALQVDYVKVWKMESIEQ